MRYSVAVFAVAIATGVRLALDAVLVQNAPFITFFLPIMAVAYFGGRGPGLAATALSLLTGLYFFLEPRYSFAIAHAADTIVLALFAVSGLCVTLLIGKLRDSLAAVSESGETNSALLESSGQAIIGVGDDRRIAVVNAMAERLFGYTRAELLGQPLEMLIPERLRERHRAHHASYVASRPARAMGPGGCLSGRRKDGSEFPIEVTLNTVQTRRGLLSVSFVTDISERRQQEEALQQTSEQRRLALEAAELGAWDYRFDTGEVFWDQHCRDMFGVPAGPPTAYDEAIARIHPEDRQAIEDALKRALAGADDGAYHREFRVVWPDGSVHWITSHGRVYFEGEAGKSRALRFVGVNSDITERKRAEEALRESEERWRLAMVSAGLGAVDFDPRTGKASWSRFAKQQFGLPPDAEVDYETFWRGVHPEDRERVKAAIESSLRPGSDGQYALEYRTVGIADGKERWVSAWGQAFFNGQQHPIRMLGVTRDITDSKLAQEKLERSEERFRTLFESMDEGFASCEIIYDEAGRPIDFTYLAVNPAFTRLTGLTAEQTVGRTVREIFPEIEPSWIEAYGRVVKTGRGERIYNRVSRLGKHLDASAWCSGPGRFAVVFTDVTERTLAEEALRLHAELINLSHDAIITADAERAIRTWNGGAAEMYGWSETEAVGGIMHELLQTRSPISTGHIDVVLKQEGRWDGELAHTAKDGRVLRVESRQVLVSNGDSSAILEINRDITERRRAEEELHRLNAELEQRIRERTVELEATNKELEAFAYSVSHDLRSPLRGIDGWSQALLEDYADRLDGEGREYLDKVRSEAQRMGVLINDLLQLSRVTRDPMEREDVDLTSMARSMAERLRESEPGRSLAFAIEPGLTGKGDFRLLEIALTNLLGNAVKYTGPRAEARIEFGQIAGEEGPAFFVRDNGVGFNMAYVHKLFGAFQRLHKLSEFPGTGIGLATVQRIIHRHGGRVWAEGQPDHGATFYFTLSRGPNDR
ncbi:MAG: PAS domain S-box protein [Bryobacteraceae bacterium]